MFTQKIANIFDHIREPQIMALGHSRLGLKNKFWGNKSGRIFLRSKGLLYKFLPSNLRVCKPTFYTFYTSHLRRNSTIHHTDLRQNAVFHNFQDKLYSVIIQDDQSRTFSGTVQNHPYGQPVLISSASCQCGRVFEWTLIELRFNIIANLLLFFFVI